MILAFDTYYFHNKAKTVCVSFENWSDESPKKVDLETLEGIADYEPGAFYKRELPCILSLLKRFDLNEVELIIVDGYVVLDDEGKLGLGGHLFEKLNQEIPVIGVAKSKFNANNLHSKELLRGSSKNPLYISSNGIEIGRAFECIKYMHGNHRIPTLLQILDTKTKEKIGKKI